jgi:hypothetical protein
VAARAPRRRRHGSRILLGLLILAILSGPLAVGAALLYVRSSKGDRPAAAATPPAQPSPATLTTVAPATDSPELGGPVATRVPLPTTPAAAVAAAVAVGTDRGTRVGVAVRDRRTGATYVGGEPDASFFSASLVKVFIAARLLAEDKAEDPTVRDRMHLMIVASDDDAASDLYPVAGGEELVGWISARYHITGLRVTTDPGAWGLTGVTARAMVAFYAAVATDAKVGPWLLDAMGDAAKRGSDGFDQNYGLMPVARTWRVKQGWLCCVDGMMWMHSTGYVDQDRFAIALLTEGDPDAYDAYARETVTLMARALLPQGTLPGA